MLVLYLLPQLSTQAQCCGRSSLWISGHLQVRVPKHPANITSCATFLRVSRGPLHQKAQSSASQAHLGGFQEFSCAALFVTCRSAAWLSIFSLSASSQGCAPRVAHTVVISIRTRCQAATARVRGQGWGRSSSTQPLPGHLPAAFATGYAQAAALSRQGLGPVRAMYGRCVNTCMRKQPNYTKTQQNSREPANGALDTRFTPLPLPIWYCVRVHLVPQVTTTAAPV